MMKTAEKERVSQEDRKDKRYYDKEYGRLVYIGERGTPGFWDKHWDTEDFKGSIEKGKNNRFVLKTLMKYIPDKKGKILEGGCGLGQKVYCMHMLGYECIGIDSAPKTIERIKEAFPKLDVKVGDIRDLHYPDNFFRGYWSLGVIEHIWEGYDDILKEMQRILINGGYIFLTFPYMSPLRRLKAKLGLYKKFHNKDKEDFYQFALDEKVVVEDFKTSGFKLLEKKPTDGLKGLKDEIGIFKPFLQKLYDYQGKNLGIRGFIYLLDKNAIFIGAGHMIFMVFRKTDSDNKNVL